MERVRAGVAAFLQLLQVSRGKFCGAISNGEKEEEGKERTSIMGSGENFV